MREPAARQIAQELQLLRSDRMDVRFHGESMRPLLQDGDRVIVEPVGWAEIRVGDLLTYRFEDKFPTRRVIRRGRDSVLLWCDNWPELRFRVSRRDVLGRAIARERDGARLAPTDPEWRAATERAWLVFRRSRGRRTIKRIEILLRRVTRRWRRDGGA